jgi:hypothetical protein
MSEPRARLGAVAAALLCLATFVGAAALLRRVTPHGSGLERMDVKLDAFAPRKDEFTLLFLGSSRTIRGFVPAQFDAALAARGVQVRSFNLGVPGGRLPEMLHMLERVAELEPQSLDYVLIDPEDFELIHDTRNALAQSGIAWHDPATTQLALEHLATSARDDQFERAADHLQALGFNLLNVGRTSRWVNAALGREPSPRFVADSLGERGDGHTALFDDQDTLAVRRRRFERGRAEYERMVEVYRAQPQPERAPPPQFLALLARFEAGVRALGAEPVYVIQPALARQWDLIAAAQAGAIKPLLRYDDPELHADLFAHSSRFDSLHLNDVGAEIFTRKLASDFADWVTRREGAGK